MDPKREMAVWQRVLGLEEVCPEPKPVCTHRKRGTPIVPLLLLLLAVRMYS